MHDRLSREYFAVAGPAKVEIHISIGQTNAIERELTMCPWSVLVRAKALEFSYSFSDEPRYDWPSVYDGRDSAES